MHSLLVVTAQEQLEPIVKRSLPAEKQIFTEVRHSATSARRAALERYFDMVLINAPLPEENGVELALDIAENTSAGILMLVPRDSFGEACDRVVDEGILVAARPLPHGGLGRLLRFLAATQEKLQSVRDQVEKEKEKLEDLKVITRAKFLLVKEKKMSEKEAHRYIQQEAMDTGLSSRRVAESILEEYE